MFRFPKLLKQILATAVLTCTAVFMIHDYSSLLSKVTESSKSAELNLVLILCGGGQGTQGEAIASDIDRQLQQAEVMLKSAVLLSKKRLHFYVLADDVELYERFVNSTADWPDKYRRKLKFSRHDVWYPEDREDMRTMFRVCATERLFIPDIFPFLDKVIYIDTDLIFMRPVEHLWDFFAQFKEKQLAGMTACLNHYGTKKNKVPYYGETGLNAGIMHMDLAKMRELKKGWSNSNLAVYDKFKKDIKLADQDILNIYFSFHPEQLYLLPCSYNYRGFVCGRGENKCPLAEKEGISIIHGNALAFVKGNEWKIQKVYEVLQDFDLNVDKPGKLYHYMKTALKEVDKENLPSKCKNVKGIDEMMLKQLRQYIPGGKLL